MIPERDPDKRRAELLADLLTSEAWREIVAPTIQARQQEILRRLAVTPLGIEEVRGEQGAYRALELILADPKTFFRDRS